MVKQIISQLMAAKAGNIVRAEGTWGSFGAMLAEHIWERTNRPVLYLCPHIDDADKALDDLKTFGVKEAEALGAWEGAEELADATDEIRADRLRICLKISGSDDNYLIAAPIQALQQPVAKPQALEATKLKLEAGNEMSPERVAAWLVDNGFETVEAIDLPGQFARRGGIVDVFAPLVSGVFSDKGEQMKTRTGGDALRIEFFGDTMESIRPIDLDTLRSSAEMRKAEIVSAVRGTTAREREQFLNILRPDTIVICEEPTTVEEVANVYIERVSEKSGLYVWRDIYKTLANFAQLHISRFGTGDEEHFRLNAKSVQQYQRKATNLWAGHKEALEELVNEAKRGKKVLLYCETTAEINRVTEIIEQTAQKVPSNLKLILGYINQGFEISSLNTILISHHELFGQYALRRRQRPMRASAPVDTLADLETGDYVVHVSYGIGRFLGVETIRGEEGTEDYLTIEFADKVKVHVSVSNITLVQKYIGTSPRRPNLSKVGSKKWAKQKEKVTQAIEDLARELLEIQARRQAIGGISFGPDTAWQMEFEEAFPYEETADQITAAQEIKSDMKETVAMDRLLCGDVGYGKTELAMRAAFKAVEEGKQVAVLVPTTVLCVQHGRTLTERFADFPISIEVLNRFRTSKQAADIISGAKAGKVDIVIGTHRLLSKDVGFKDLGLLIIDEEQRFGVAHKERLKKLRVNVDVLTMTATPIPRTLHMAMLGLRDISSLGTPPLDRRAVVTNVTSYNNESIRKAIIRELNRQGQVFFLHNRVKTIEKKAWELRKLLSDTGARISVAHGRMAKSELEKAMIDFVTGKTDVLVCTTIIESGLDIPNANTIFIDNADRFGLAELHQLRGRVGRYKYRAYAYMLLPKTRSITPVAARRLKAIEEYSHLGAGFRIALRDLEIRGAGNILGPEQSGHIQLVGYQMYCELLAEAVHRLKGEKVEKAPSVVLELGFSAAIPKNYIPQDKARMEAYRKIAAAKAPDEIPQIENEFTDVYGPFPQEVALLLELAQLRIMIAQHNIKSLIASPPNLIFSFTEPFHKETESLLANTSGIVRIIDPKTIYLKLTKNHFEPNTLIILLRKMFQSK